MFKGTTVLICTGTPFSAKVLNPGASMVRRKAVRDRNIRIR